MQFDPAPPRLDTAVIEALAVHTADKIEGLLDRFAAQLLAATANIERARSSDEREEALRGAHSLKSVSATFGAHAVAADAARVERLLREDGAVDEVGGALSELEEECRATEAELAAWRRRRAT